MKTITHPKTEKYPCCVDSFSVLLGVVNITSNFELVSWREGRLRLEEFCEGLAFSLDLLELILGQQYFVFAALEMLGDLVKIVRSLDQAKVQVSHPQYVAEKARV